MELYIFEHCPYCVKARMIFGLKQLKVELVYLLNDDEQTPVSLVGKKVVPILGKDDGTYMPESMEIVSFIDQNYGQQVLRGAVSVGIKEWIAKTNSYVGQLLLPRYAKSDFE